MLNLKTYKQNLWVKRVLKMNSSNFKLEKLRDKLILMKEGRPPELMRFIITLLLLRLLLMIVVTQMRINDMRINRATQETLVPVSWPSKTAYTVL